MPRATAPGGRLLPHDLRPAQHSPRSVAGECAALRVSTVTGRAAFLSLAAEWDALVEATGAPFFCRHEWLRIWIASFAPQARLRVLLARDAGGALVAALPLLRVPGTLYGLPVRELISPTNDHSPRFDLIARDGPAAAAAFFPYLAAAPGWDVLRLNEVPDGGNAWHLYERARAAGWPCGTWPSLQSPYLPLAGLTACRIGHNAKFRANVRRLRHRLESQGRVTVERVTGGPDLARWLATAYALEESGWKGRQGTAIDQDSHTRGFYTELARTAAAAGRLALYFLLLDDRPIAFHYTLTCGTTCAVLKTGYDETHREVGPGQLLTAAALEDCLTRGLAEFDFLGPDMPWKRDWTDRVRPHTWLYLFRPTPYGRALHALKFRAWPALKARAARWRR